MRNNECCANCEYFDVFKEQKRDDNLIGACKADPPSPAPSNSKSNLGVWPIVLGNFWCGVFSQKEKGEKNANEFARL